VSAGAAELAGTLLKATEPSVVQPHLGLVDPGRLDPEDDLPILHQIEAISGNETDVLRIVNEEIFLPILASQQLLLAINGHFQFVDPLLLITLFADLRQGTMPDCSRHDHHDERQHEAVEGGPETSLG
jgi:hypothetical protein